MTTVLVVGASGGCGKAVTAQLVARGAVVRGFVRDDDRAQVAREAGATEIAIGDLRDIGSIDAALKGVDGVFHLGPAYMPEEAQVGIAVANAALRAGVERLIYSSALHPIASAMLNHDVKRQVEEHLIATDLDFTIMQPARFMQGVAYSWPAIVSDKAFREPFRVDAKMAFVDYEDVAEAVAICFTEPGYGRATFELSAEGEQSRVEQAAIISEILGEEIKAEPCVLEDWLPPPLLANPYLREGLTRMFGYYDTVGFRGGNSLSLRTILGRPATDYAAFAARFIAQTPG